MNVKLHKNVIRMSKLGIYVIIVVQSFSMCLAGEVTAQQKFLKEINLELRDVQEERSLLDLVNEIEQLTDFRFAYSKKEIKDKAISIQGGIWNLSDLLKEVSTQAELSIKRVNESISFLEAKRPGNLPQLEENIAEQTAVTGKITDESGEGLPGAAIQEKGTTNGTISDVEGAFSLNVPEDALLSVSFVGFQTKEIPVNGRTKIDVQLEADVSALDEVVVVGYGKQVKGQMTGSVSTVEGEQLVNRSIGNVTQALQGVVQGLRIVQSAGQPGKESVDMNIRGISTFTNNPVLTIVDGIPTDLNSINQNDIESISVLKDAAAASIYGTRASGGVILITTKKGKKGAPKLAYSGTVGVQQATRIPQKVTAYQHAINYNEAEANDSPGTTSFTFSEADLARFSSSDWVDPDMPGYLFNSAMITQHNFDLTGGGDNQDYFISLGYLKQDGIVRNTGYERFNLRLTQNINVGERLTVSFRGSISPSVRTEPASVSYPGGPNSSLATAIREAFRYGNEVPLFTPEGEWASIRGGTNALALSSAEGGNQTLKGVQATGNLSLKYDILDNLKFTFLYGITHNQSKEEDFRKKMTLYNPFTSGVIDTEVLSNALRITNSSSNLQSIQMLLDYDLKFNSHSLSLLGGFTQESFFEDNQSVGRSDFLTEDTQVISAGSSDRNLWTTAGTASDWGLRSFIGRASYSFLNRYILEGSFRIDGSSRFVPDLRWAVFPSISGAWRVSDEAFLKNNEVIDFLRLRSSWGKVGNQNVGFYPFAYTLSTRTYPIGGVPQQTVYTRSAANPDLTWETKAAVNLGFDIYLLDGLIEVSGDIYKETTSDILLTVPIPSTVGFSAPPQNVGIVENKGWELLVTHRRAINDFRYSVSFNISDATNKVVDLKGAGPFIRDQASVTNSPGGQITEVGHPMDMWYGYESDGLFQSNDEVSNHAFQSVHTSAGDIRFIDQNGDNVINSDDRARLERSDIRYPYGISINLGYKNFEFSALAQGVLSHYQHVYGWLGNNFDRPSSTLYEYHLDRWTPDNPDARFPKHRVAQAVGINAQFSSFVLQNAAYFRMKNMQLGYNVPESLLEKVGVDGAKIFITGENVFTLTKFLGLDPEVDAIRDMTYPNAKVFSVGVNVRL